MPSAARTRARRASTARILRTSRHTGWSGGWLNWRLRSGRRLTDQRKADPPPEIYAYRAGRNAQQAVVEVEELVFRGHPDVVDADLADYFGSIPHADLLKSVARRIVDRRVLHLIKMWLECPVEETDQRGRTRRTTEARD